MRIGQAENIKNEEYQLGMGNVMEKLGLWLRRSFSWQKRRNPNPCAPPTLNPPSDCWLAEGPRGALQAVAFQTSTVASAAVVEYTPPKKPCHQHHPLSVTHKHTHLGSITTSCLFAPVTRPAESEL